MQVRIDDEWENRIQKRKKERERKGNSDGRHIVLLTHLSSGSANSSLLKEVLKGVYRLRVIYDGPAFDLKYMRIVFKDSSL